MINDFFTLPQTNIAPEIGPSQKEIHLPIIHFQVAFAVSFRKGTPRKFRMEPERKQRN